MRLLCFYSMFCQLMLKYQSSIISNTNVSREKVNFSGDRKLEYSMDFIWEIIFLIVSNWLERESSCCALNWDEQGVSMVRQTFAFFFRGVFIWGIFSKFNYKYQLNPTFISFQYRPVKSWLNCWPFSRESIQLR